jgi:aconitate hydratase
VYFSRPGNGICHQVHLERFAAPGKTLVGSDSHTPTAGGIGSFAVGAGGLDVAVAMGGGSFYLSCPAVLAVELKGALPDWVSAKDIILRLLSILSTRGNVGAVVEYCGEGLNSLSVPARATCTNMGAELGVTSSIFPADELTRQFLAAQGRLAAFTALAADSGAQYDRLTKKLHVQKDALFLANIRRCCPDAQVAPPDAEGNVKASFSRIVIDLSELEPLAAAPGSPENIVPIAQLAGAPVDQVVIGSCTNSSLRDLSVCAAVLKGRTVHPRVELGIAPGSRQVLAMMTENGGLAAMVAAGARILESACGPCIGQGFSPGSGRVSLRTFNRNFTGRSGASDDKVYLVSPETAVAAAITGQITDPRRLGIDYPSWTEPKAFKIDDGMIIPAHVGEDVEIVRPASIVKPPSGQPLPDPIEGVALIKVGDKITTDHIMPAGGLLKHRSNVPEYAKHVFNPLNKPGEPTFAQRAEAAAKAGKAGIIVAGESYGQGSSREHAALCPMYLGVRAVIAKSIERIHQANLVNFAILPLTFANPADYDRVSPGDNLEITGTAAAVASAERVTVANTTRGFAFDCVLKLSPRQRQILAAGGLLAYTRQGGQ